MEMKISHDSAGTHIDWEHEGVTAKMIDWFWSNMEKGFILWHPSQHEPLTWVIPPKHGNPVGSVHLAPQTWSDGTRQNLYIRFEDLATVPEYVKKYIVYEHCVVVAGLGFGEESLNVAVEDVMGYRIHQWQKTDFGVEGKSSGIGVKKKETREDGLVWAKHCGEEVGNWGEFLPQLYTLYRAVTNTETNPYADLSVEGAGKSLKYKYIE